MKHRLCVGVVVCFALCMFPSFASSQGMSGGALPGLPSLPSLRGMLGLGSDCSQSGGVCTLALSADAGWNYQAIGFTAMGLSPEKFGAMLTFSILLAVNEKDDERYDETAPISIARDWKTKNDTYSFTGMGLYDAVGCALVTEGFRWDHLETTFERPYNDFSILGLPSDESVLIVNV